MVRPVPSLLILIVLLQKSSQHTGVYPRRGLAGSCAGGSEAIRNSQGLCLSEWHLLLQRYVFCSVSITD